MKVLIFGGNLGNQIFGCAFKDYLIEKNPNERVYLYVARVCPKVVVQDDFNLELPQVNALVSVLTIIVMYTDLIINKLFHMHLSKKIICPRGPITEESIFFTNYLHDKYYFEDKDSSWLQAKVPQDVSKEYKVFENQILSTNSISVHIRRGDYIKPESSYVDLSSTDYYERAIKVAREKYPSGTLFFFSDDLSFVKERFGDSNSVYVDCNKGANSYLDMKLMSLAKVNIMANSTFSYWGAYMGHEHKMVIYPKAWFTKEIGRIAPDIMLKSWIGM